MHILKKITLLIFLATAIYGCGSSSQDPKARLESLHKQQDEINNEIKKLEAELSKTGGTSKIKTIDVTAVTLTAQPFKSYLEIQGRLDADQNVTVSSQMAGTVKSVYVKEGDNVKAGQILAELDDAVMRQGIEELKNQLAFATDLFNKQKNLWDQKIGSEVQYLSAKNNKDAMEKKLQTMNEQLDLYKIKSPINGIVDEVVVKLGQIAAPGMPALRVVNLSSLKVKADVAESYAGRVREGNPVVVEFPDMLFEYDMKLTYVSKVINAMNRTFTVQVDIPTNPDLHPNMIAKLKIVDYSTPSAIVVPVNTVQNSENGQYVFIAVTGEKGTPVARKVMVETGHDYNGQIEIKNGLKEGDQLITAGYLDVEDGEFLKM